MIFTVEAGTTGASASFSKRTLPVPASIRMACGTLVSIVWARAQSGARPSSPGEPEARQERGDPRRLKSSDHACPFHPEH